jgi:hypothetical protein
MNEFNKQKKMKNFKLKVVKKSFTTRGDVTTCVLTSKVVFNHNSKNKKEVLINDFVNSAFVHIGKTYGINSDSTITTKAKTTCIKGDTPDKKTGEYYAFRSALKKAVKRVDRFSMAIYDLGDSICGFSMSFSNSLKFMKDED